MKKIVFVVGTVIALLITACGGNSNSKKEDKKITFSDKDIIGALKTAIFLSTRRCPRSSGG